MPRFPNPVNLFYLYSKIHLGEGNGFEKLGSSKNRREILVIFLVVFAKVAKGGFSSRFRKTAI